MSDDFIEVLKAAHIRVQNTNRALEPFRWQPTHAASISGPADQYLPRTINLEIFQGLMNIAESLAHSYEQVYRDLTDPDRIAWAGTAHLIREILSGMLHKLAPDHEVKSEDWFVPETENERPTQRQRVRYILRKHNAGSREKEVAEFAGLIEERVGDLARATYTRASVAAHGTKDMTETRRILWYFEAVTHDILDLP